VYIKELRVRYDPSKDPIVISGKSSAEDATRDVLNSFAADVNPDGTISLQEFHQYFAGTSAGVSNDDDFAQTLMCAWGMEKCLGGAYVPESRRFPANGDLNSSVASKSYTIAQDLATKEVVQRRIAERDALHELLGKHRAFLLSSKMGFRGVGRHLRFAGSGTSMLLNPDNFFEILSRCRLYIDGPLREVAIRELDLLGNGTIDALLYLHHLLRELPAVRRLMLERLWRTFPTNDRGQTQLSWVQQNFHTSDPNQLNEFLDAWDKRLVPGGAVTFIEIEEWFTPLSEGITSDIIFEATLLGHWKHE